MGIPKGKANKSNRYWAKEEKTRIVLNLQISLRGADIITVLILSVNEHDSSFNVLIFFNFSWQFFIVLSVQALHCFV